MSDPVPRHPRNPCPAPDDEPTAQAFDRYLDQVEADPAHQARQARVRQRMTPQPASLASRLVVGAVSALMLAGLAVAVWRWTELW